ncbi:MAG: hypothetical protein K2Y23_17580 [Cyanobacteria bacterium]|nr:hypothetical protein [Cyanobacteriota bacterium]
MESFTSGFPFNQNMLLERAEADYYLLLNDDLIFLEGSVDRPLAFMLRPENKDVGMVTVKLLNADGSLQPSTYAFAGLFRTILSVSKLRELLPLDPNLFGFFSALGLGHGRSRYWSHEETVEIESCRGAYMLVRKDALRNVGGLDLRGGHETEWHMRFRQLGWKIVFFHEAEVVHLGSRTVSMDPEKDLLNLESHLNIYYKYKNGWRYASARSAFLVIYFIKYLGAAIRRERVARRVAWKGVRMIWNWPGEAR